jgi:hypothetical protein
VVVRVLGRREGITVVALAAVVMALVGCTQPAAGPSTSPDGSFDASEAPPAFSGPHASLYIEAWGDADSSFVRDVLRDETISDQEWAEVVSRLSACFSRNGVEFLGFESSGEYGVDAGSVAADRVQELFPMCERESGESPLGYLRNHILINPDGRDLDELILECMTREGAVAPDYTIDSFRRDYEHLTFPYIDMVDGEKTFWACNSDPLDLIDTE